MAGSEAAHDALVGYSGVDANPETDALVQGMELTAQWPAVVQLRAWERDHLQLAAGERLLDVGCGLGDAALALATDLAPGGEVLGVDFSEAMLAVAAHRTMGAPVPMSFRVGDVLALGEPDGSFDVVRSERMLQWVSDLDAAIDEMLRVVRPGGRISLTDTDWRTVTFDVRDTEAFSVVRAAMMDVRGEEPGRVGGLLLNRLRDRGCTDLRCTAATHVWTEWDPDSTPGPVGFPFTLFLPQVVEAGALDGAMAARFTDEMAAAGRAGRFFGGITMISVIGRRP